ncbi:MAG: hypothetical protein ACYDH6_02390 [Acidimicrobiales bacterium]
MATRLGAAQAELYEAETEALGALGIRWRKVADAQAYVDRLVCSAWFFERWPSFVRCTVERRGSGSRWSTQCALDAARSEGVILVADGGLTQPVILHELAHLLLPPETGHGPLFAETLLTLVRHEMGFAAFADCYHALRSRPEFSRIREGID